MKINTVCKFYIRDFLKTFIIIILSMSTLLSIVGLIEKIDEFMLYKSSTFFFVKYAFYSIPRYLFYLIPFVTLIASLFVFSVGVRSKEFLILSVAGGRLRVLLKPFLFLGIIISITGFIFGEFIQPAFTKKLNHMIEELTEKGKSNIQRNIFLKTKTGTVVKIGMFSPENMTGTNLKIFVIDKNNLLKRIDSETAEIGSKEWFLKNGIIYDFVNGKIEKFERMNYPLEIKISALTFKDIKKIEEFGIGELLQKRRDLKRVGLSNPKIDTDISGRLSYNFVTFFMMVLGISLPLGAYEKFSFLFTKIKGTTSASGIITVGIGLVITIIYWLLYSLFMFMGYSKMLPPFASPWITPLIFGFLSIKLYYAIKE